MWNKFREDDILLKKNRLYFVVLKSQFSSEVSAVAHYYDGFDWFNISSYRVPSYSKVTHWMEIPELPEGV